MQIIDSIYSENSELKKLLILHSQCVARKALQCATKRNILVDTQFIYEASMLHDIGIIKCNAPSIYCHGNMPYICHGIEGRKILEKLGLTRHALVCERHTGAGLSEQEIISQNLPLPHRNMLPITLEEQLICYADKFFSKSTDPCKEKPLEKVRHELSRFGEDTMLRFEEMHRKFGI